MKHRRVKSSVGKVLLFVFFVIVFTLVAARFRKEKEMRARVEKRARELEVAASVASAEYADAEERSLRSGSNDYVEEIARESLGMIMPGETVYRPYED